MQFEIESFAWEKPGFVGARSGSISDKKKPFKTVFSYRPTNLHTERPKYLPRRIPAGFFFRIIWPIPNIFGHSSKVETSDKLYNQQNCRVWEILTKIWRLQLWDGSAGQVVEHEAESGDELDKEW